MAQTVWKGYLTFGLISVPVRLFAAARREHVSFHMLHNVCGTRVRQQLFCPHCERTVERSEIVKGYPESKDSFIVVNPDELKAIAPPSERNMDIVQFVKAEEIDPALFRNLILCPAGGAGPEGVSTPGAHAGEVGVRGDRQGGNAPARVHRADPAARERAHAAHHLLSERAESSGGVRQTGSGRDQAARGGIGERLVENLAAPFEPEKFEDEYQKRVLGLIEAKREGKEVRAAAPAKVAPVVDLMEALQRSLSAAGRKPPERAEEIQPVKEPRKRPAKKRVAS